MINFSSLFNQFRSSSNNAVNQLLEQENVTLARLIDEDSFINEYKSGNNRLIQFMTYSKVKQLVDYITVVGPAEDKKRGYKFPLTASDVLSADIPSIQQYLLPDGKIYDQVKTIVEETVQVEQKENIQQQGKEDIKQNEQNKPDDTQQQQKVKETAKDEKQITIIKDSLQEEGQEQSPKTKSQQESMTPESKEQQMTPEQQTTQEVKKKVFISKKVQKTEKVQVPPLLNQLISYFDLQINYILTGYVCKVLSALFVKKPVEMMSYLFSDNNLYKIINHIESRSVGEFLLKLLTYQSNKFTSQRAQLFTHLLNKLAENNSIHLLSNFSAFISQTIVKAADNTKTNSPIAQFTQIFFTPHVVTIVIKNVMSDHQNVSIYNAPILLTYLTNVPFTLPKDQKVIQQFKFLLGMFIDKSLQKLNVKNTQKPKLGFGRIKIIEILSYILKQNLIGSRQMFASKDIAFPTLFQLCRNYEMNNVLHNQIVKLISLSFTDDLLSQALLKNDVLLSFLLQQALEDVQIRKGTGKQKYRKGFIGHVVQMARLVQQNASKGNQAAMKIIDTEDFDKILSILVEKQVSESNKDLGGFRLKKEAKNEIMFQKEDIITHYIDFLTHSPKPVFEPQPQLINIQHPDLVQEMQRQLQENQSLSEQQKQQKANGQLVVQNMETIEQTKTYTIESMQAMIKVQINYFKGHLDYDVEKLLEEL